MKLKFKVISVERRNGAQLVSKVGETRSYQPCEERKIELKAWKETSEEYSIFPIADMTIRTIDPADWELFGLNAEIFVEFTARAST